MTPYEAHYCCIQCKHKFTLQQGLGHAQSKACPKCGHLWVEWLNFKTLQKQKGWRQY